MLSIVRLQKYRGIGVLSQNVDDFPPDDTASVPRILRSSIDELSNSVILKSTENVLGYGFDSFDVIMDVKATLLYFYGITQGIDTP